MSQKRGFWSESVPLRVSRTENWEAALGRDFVCSNVLIAG